MKDFSEKEFLLLAYLEGDLSESEIVRVEAMLAEDAALLSEYRLLKKIILPIETLTYSSKASLKKAIVPQKISLGYLIWTGAVAAVLAILILFYSPTIISPSPSIAKIEKRNTAQNITPNHSIDKSKILAKVDKKANKSTAIAKSSEKRGTNKPASIKYIVWATTTKQTNNTPFEKKEWDIPLLSVKKIKIPIEFPSTEISVNTDLSLPQPTPITLPNKNYENKRWWARTSKQINNKLNTWVSYLQKPKIEINKEKPLGGRTYWAIIVEADKYEWEGKLYTRR